MNGQGTDKRSLLERSLGQESNARQYLFEVVRNRVDTDVEFRRKMAVEPAAAVREVVASLPDEARGEIKEEDVEAAAREYSQALPDLKKDPVADMIFTTIEDTRRSFNLSLKLTSYLFVLGLFLILATFLAILVTDVNETVTLVFGGGAGVIGIVTALLINPIDRVQNAACHLVQLEIAFLSYYKQLSLLTPPAGASTETSIQYAAELRLAMQETITLIEEHCGYKKANSSPHAPPTATASK